MKHAPQVETPTSSEPAPPAHAAFKFRIDPSHQQEALFEEMTRAARWGFNKYTAACEKHDKKYRAREQQLLESGLDASTAKAVIKEEAKRDPELRRPSEDQFRKEVLTPETQRHREAAKLLWQRDHGEEWSPPNFNNGLILSGTPRTKNLSLFFTELPAAATPAG